MNSYNYTARGGPSHLAGLPQMDTSSATATGQKRKRSPLDTQMPHPVSSRAPGAEGQQFHLQINYLARRDATNLPIVSATDTLPNILGILDKYAGVLERHESVAANLGCRPLGPILIKRFERLFDGPVKVVHYAQGIVGATPVTWLDVVEFAKARPQDFTLTENKDGGRVCRCRINQCEVEISEEDYVLIASGMPQKIIPPQPIEEDEEKELGSLETLEKNLSQIILSADAVSMQARQLKHRFGNRRKAINIRRGAEAANNPGGHGRPGSAGSGLLSMAPGTEREPPRHTPSPTPGFVAVNTRQTVPANGNNQENIPSTSGPMNGTTSRPLADSSNRLKPITTGDAENKHRGQSNFSTADTLLKVLDKQVLNGGSDKPPHVEIPPYNHNDVIRAASVPQTPNIKSPSIPPTRPSPAQVTDDDGPFRAEMLRRMERLPRGDPVLPPCDRCRRLERECLKNLTACMGCTKKHARCSWKKVTQEELEQDEARLRSEVVSGSGGGGGGGGEKVPTTEEDVKMIDAEAAEQASEQLAVSHAQGNGNP
ncbi:hypothetical protein FGG08_000107 [Glutinoglossum americanum]|uniref:Zn(2)-C6 fungal-type domain-containing protein n=1 Tax=Glutinoglossum americanum TaxID=1670608 RepID=A0A9P8L698_9PEZI|nr:hypothetical protein FGG08_000107 [Glutinoglossum americanum]